MADNGLESPPEQLRPMQTIPHDPDASPIRGPVSPTLARGRVTLGELTPGTVARRTRSRVGLLRVPRVAAAPETGAMSNARPRSRPGLSPDKIGKHFAVKLDTGYEYSSSDVRFVLWYYCRTVLQYDAIATVYNSTYTEAEPQMSAAEVEAIIETIKLRWPSVKADLRPGHFAPPDSWGWYPCDHLMGCSGTEADGKKSVIRNTKSRVFGIKWIREVLTTIWEGSWEELLQCPRNHDVFEDQETSEEGLVIVDAIEEASVSDQLSARGRAESEISSAEEEDEWEASDGDPLDDIQDEPLRHLIRLVGGPKPFYQFVQITLGAVLLFSILADWFRPLPPAAMAKAPRISTLDLKSFCFMMYGAFALLRWFLNMLKTQMLVFRGVDRPPPLTTTEKIEWFFLGVIVAIGFAMWKGWHSSIEYFFDWVKTLFPRSLPLDFEPVTLNATHSEGPQDLVGHVVF